MTDGCACCNGKDDNWMGHVRSLIAQDYWRVMMVMEGSQHDEPPFAYSTGLTSQGKPELIVYGLDLDTARDVINDVGQRLADGQAITAGSRLSKVLQGCDVTMIDVVNKTDMTETGAFYGDFTALQIVYPDQQDRFPWDAGYSLCEGQQPLTGPPPA